MFENTVAVFTNLPAETKSLPRENVMISNSEVSPAWRAYHELEESSRMSDPTLTESLYERHLRLSDRRWNPPSSSSLSNSLTLAISCNPLSREVILEASRKETLSHSFTASSQVFERSVTEDWRHEITLLFFCLFLEVFLRNLLESFLL
jgi:hypothetical protein